MDLKQWSRFIITRTMLFTYKFAKHLIKLVKTRIREISGAIVVLLTILLGILALLDEDKRCDISKTFGSDLFCDKPTPSPITAIQIPQSINSLQVAYAQAQNYDYHLGNNAWIPMTYNFEGITMVLVPPGCFMMGSTSFEDEQPVHKQCFVEPYWIDQTEVTQAQFKQFNGISTEIYSPQFQGSNRPVDRITWLEARNFCALRGMRLPTEAEWEYAARGPEGLTYPWGNWNPYSTIWNGQALANVASISQGASWVKAFDLSGNVWEWTNSLYRPYPYDVTSETGDDNLDGTARVMRGGSWSDYDQFDLRAAKRLPNDSLYGRNGFRCAASIQLTN